MKTGYSGWLDVCVGGPLIVIVVFGFSIGQAKKRQLKSTTPALQRLSFEPIGKLSQPDSASTLVGSDMIMGRNLPYQPTHHQELLRHFQAA